VAESIEYDAIVLAGGDSTRFGADKLAADLAGRPLLDHVLDGLAGAVTVVAVGGERPTSSPVVWCRENPPGGGPAAGLAEGLARGSAPIVLVAAGDMPFIGRAVSDLLDACENRDGAVLVDDSDRLQPLAAAYSRRALERAYAELGQETSGAAMRRLIGTMDLARVRDRHGASLDCDSPADVARAAQILTKE